MIKIDRWCHKHSLPPHPDHSQSSLPMEEPLEPIVSTRPSLGNLIKRKICQFYLPLLGFLLLPVNEQWNGLMSGVPEGGESREEAWIIPTLNYQPLHNCVFFGFHLFRVQHFKVLTGRVVSRSWAKPRFRSVPPSVWFSCGACKACASDRDSRKEGELWMTQFPFPLRGKHRVAF